MLRTGIECGHFHGSACPSPGPLGLWCLFCFSALAQIPPGGRCIAFGRGSRCRPAPLPPAAARAVAASGIGSHGANFRFSL